MFVSGQSQAGDRDLLVLTFLVAIPSGVKVFNWLTTMYKGTIILETPMLYALTFFLLFAIGGLTGIFLGHARDRRPPATTPTSWWRTSTT